MMRAPSGIRGSRWRRLVIGTLVVGSIAVAGWVGASRQRPAQSLAPNQDRKALIKFSHAKHLKEVEATCADCHGGVVKSTQASDNHLGKMAACYACHDQETTECAFC